MENENLNTEETANSDLGAVRRSLNIVNFIICEITKDGVQKLDNNFTTRQSAVTWLMYNGIKGIKYCILEELSIY